MSHTDPVPVDRDLLADHLGGALAGTPEEARVAHLIATEPEWARAAAELTDAFQTVAADLGAVGPPPAMPDDVAARLDTVLRSLSPVPSTGIAATSSGAGAPAPDRVAAPPSRTGPRLSGQRPGDQRPGGAPPAGPQRRRRRVRAAWAGIAAVAVVAFAAVGLGPLGLADQLTGGGGDAAGDAAFNAPADAPGGAPDGAPGGPPGGAPEAPAEAEDGAALNREPGTDRDDTGRPALTASGLDYEPDAPMLQRAYGALPEQGSVAPRVQQERPDTPLSTGAGVPAELAPLWRDPDPCLRAIRTDYRSTEIDIHVADFATFERSPAVVIWLTANDQRQVLVVGPECGQPDAGLDERYRAALD